MNIFSGKDTDCPNVVRGPFTLDEDKQILLTVFKFLNINNIKLYEGSYRPIQWRKLFANFDRKFARVKVRWSCLVNLLKSYEDSFMDHKDLACMR